LRAQSQITLRTISSLLSPATQTSRRKSTTQLPSAKICEDAPLCSQPNKYLNVMWTLSSPQGLPITIHCWKKSIVAFFKPCGKWIDVCECRYNQYYMDYHR